VTTTAGHLIGTLADHGTGTHYQNAMIDIHTQLRRPNLQRQVFSFAQASPSEIVRSKLSTSEIQYRALTYLPDDLLSNIPEDDNLYSLFQGFQASVSEGISEHRKGHRRHSSRGRKLLTDAGSDAESPTSMGNLKRDKQELNHRLEMLSVRKNMASCEIKEIDNKIANLNHMRKIVLDRLADLEQDESVLEHDRRRFGPPRNHLID
jgi:division protein 1